MNKYIENRFRSCQNNQVVPHLMVRECMQNLFEDYKYLECKDYYRRSFVGTVAQDRPRSGTRMHNLLIDKSSFRSHKTDYTYERYLHSSRTLTQHTLFGGTTGAGTTVIGGITTAFWPDELLCGALKTKRYAPTTAATTRRINTRIIPTIIRNLLFELEVGPHL